MKNEEISLRTKQSMASTLRELMFQKPFNKITVSEIIERNQINRKTFYYHFSDIHDLLCWMIEQETTVVVKRLFLMNDYHTAVQYVLDYIDNNSRLICCALDSSASETVHRYFVDCFIDISVMHIKDAERRYGVSLSDEHRDFLSMFYSEATAGMIIAWIKSNRKWSKRMAAEYYELIIRESMRSILQSENK